MRHSDGIGALVAALAKAQQEIRNPALDSVNPHFKNRYASLGAHLEAVREPLAKQGLVLSQHVENTEDGVAVTTLLAHASGEWMSSSVAMPLPDRATAQNLGAIVSYLRRYAIGSVAFLTGEEDDDAERDRQARSLPKPAPRPSVAPAAPAKPAPRPDSELLSPVPAPVKSEAKALAAKEPSMQPKRRWPETGKDVVKVEKIVDRDGKKAVLCTLLNHGQAWVSFDPSLMSDVQEGRMAEIAWKWSGAGFYEAVSADLPPTVRSQIARGEIPF